MSRQHDELYERPEQGGVEEFNQNDAVEVRIRANFWAVGFVIGGLQFFFVWVGYGVEFSSPSEQRQRDIFGPMDVRRA